MNNKHLKSELRKNIRYKRQALSSVEIEQSGVLLNHQIEKNCVLDPHQHIACFLSFDGEISTNQVIQSIWGPNKTCYLPKLISKTDSNPNHLNFLPFEASSKMVPNQFGIPEVVEKPSIEISQLDIVFFPLVAFDLSGYRLGMGGGFYDATFASLKHSKDRPKFIGLAHDFQQVENVPKEKWDLPLDGVCTPSRFIEF